MSGISKQVKHITSIDDLTRSKRPREGRRRPWSERVSGSLRNENAGILVLQQTLELLLRSAW